MNLLDVKSWQTKRIRKSKLSIRKIRKQSPECDRLIDSNFVSQNHRSEILTQNQAGILQVARSQVDTVKTSIFISIILHLIILQLSSFRLYPPFTTFAFESYSSPFNCARGFCELRKERDPERLPLDHRRHLKRRRLKKSRHHRFAVPK